MNATSTEFRSTCVAYALAPLCVIAPTLLFGHDARAATALPGLTEKTYLLVAAVFEDKILRFDGATGQYIDDFIAPKSGGLDEPSGMAIGADGNLYVASAQNNQILRYDGRSGAFLGVFATDGQIPIGLSFGPGGDLFVASRDALGILRYDGQTGASKGVFATTNAPLPGNPSLTVNWWPWDLVFRPDGNVYLSSFERSLVLQFDAATGQYEGIFANGRSSSALSRAAGLAFGPDGDLYLAGYFGEIVRFDGTTGAIDKVFADIAGDPTNIRFGPDGDMYVALRDRGAILRVDGDTGNVLGDFTMGGQWESTHFILFTSPIPEPASFVIALSLLAIFHMRRRRREYAIPIEAGAITPYALNSRPKLPGR